MLLCVATSHTLRANMDNSEVKFEQSHSLNREIQLDKIYEENPRDSRDEVNTSHGDEEQREKLIRLPLGRIKTIIKMDPEVCLVNQEATFLVAKSVVNIEKLTVMHFMCSNDHLFFNRNFLLNLLQKKLINILHKQRKKLFKNVM